MILSSVLFPAPFEPRTPIFAPGKKESQMPFRTSRSGGYTLRRSFMVKMNWVAIVRRWYTRPRAASNHGTPSFVARARRLRPRRHDGDETGTAADRRHRALLVGDERSPVPHLSRRRMGPAGARRRAALREA